MTEIPQAQLWTVIAALAVGSFALRFLFIGLVGNRVLPEWLMRHLRYTAVAMLPALVTPLVVWPSVTDGALDPPRLIAAIATLVVGYLTRNVVLAILAGAGTLYALLFLLG